MPSPRPTQPDTTVTVVCEGPPRPADTETLESLCSALAGRIAAQMPGARVLRGGGASGLIARMTLTSLRADAVAGRLDWLRDGALARAGTDVGMDIMDAELRASHLDDFADTLLRTSPVPE